MRRQSPVQSQLHDLSQRRAQHPKKREFLSHDNGQADEEIALYLSASVGSPAHELHALGQIRRHRVGRAYLSDGLGDRKDPNRISLHYYSS